MENGTSGGASTGPGEAAKGRRPRRTGIEIDLRYFLPANDSSISAPKLGQEAASEGEALIQAFKSGQHFYTLAVWKAVPEVNGGGSPVIVKQAVTKG
jgi:hypothetical protein